LFKGIKMNRDGHKDVSYFIGPEVEHTPAYSKRTLFVVGKQDVVQIERMAREYKTPHIFMGADHSFFVDPMDMTFYWDKTITTLLDKGFWVTLDYQAHEHRSVLLMLNKGIWQSRLFVPLLSVRIPNVQTSSVNLTIKIDDVDFNATNAGVWCLNHHEITDSNRFTDWQDYTTDEVVAPLAGPAHTLPLRVPAPAPVFADINKPAVNLEKAKEVIEAVKNDTVAGLDPSAVSQLKPDESAEASATLDVIDAASAAEAYAEGTTKDPLSAKESTKKAKGKA
jgi:hypothetical protein